MKKLTGAFGKKKKEETPTLVLPTKVGDTVPRKIDESDHDFLKEYAFRKRFTMLEATEGLFGKIREEIEEKSISIISVDVEGIETKGEKSIRLSSEFNDYLKTLSHETKVPMKFIFSFFIEYFKTKLESEMKS